MLLAPTALISSNMSTIVGKTRPKMMAETANSTGSWRNCDFHST